jgi:hypothetical protein
MMKRLALAAVFALAALNARAVTFIEDDYSTAIARAKAKKVPVFVEAWAPW